MSTTEGVELAEKWLALRIKSKKSQSTILRDVSTKQTVHEFIVKLAEMTDVPEDKMMILTGFPPKKIELDRLALLESLGLSNQDTVIVELDVNSSAAPAAGISKYYLVCVIKNDINMLAEIANISNALLYF